MINKQTVKTIRGSYHARGHNEGFRTYNLGFGFIHYSLIRNIRPEKVLCIGSDKGYIPSICALACKNEEKGKVDFVDAGYAWNIPSEQKYAWGGEGIWKNLPKDYWSPLEIEDYIKLYVTTTEKFITKNKDNFYGYITIDGDHSYEGVKKDFELLWPRLLPGGFICLHSTLREDKWGGTMAACGKCGVKKFWNEIKDNYKHFEIKFTAGLGVIQK